MDNVPSNNQSMRLALIVGRTDTGEMLHTQFRTIQISLSFLIAGGNNEEIHEERCEHVPP